MNIEEDYHDSDHPHRGQDNIEEGYRRRSRRGAHPFLVSRGESLRYCNLSEMVLDLGDDSATQRGRVQFLLDKVVLQS